MPQTDPITWKRLCGLAVTLVQGQAAFRLESGILKRLVKKFGAHRVEYMLLGAQALGWSSLRSLGSQDGLGRRIAEAAYWRGMNTRPKDKPLTSIGDILGF